MFLRTVLILLMLAGVQVLRAQSYIGQRETINYSKKQYNAGTQNWKIKQDAQGRIYFANNEGVLVFDGANWQLYPLPNKTIVWSIEFGADKRLYAGGQDEIGYFSPGKNGLLVFTSLKELLPKADRKFSDVWDIVALGNDIFFRSRNKIFRYHDNQMTAYPSVSGWLYLGVYKNQLLAFEDRKGIMLYKDGNWQTFIEKSKLPAGFYITSTLPIGVDSTLITTARNGNYILTGRQLSYWPLNGLSIDNHQHFLSAIALGDGYLLGTYTNGAYLVDKKGHVSENISKKEGLQNSNIRCLFMDTNQNIWLGLDNGIDLVTYNNAVKHINPAIFKDGGGFSMTKYNNSLYFALSNGIYELPFQNIPDQSYNTGSFKLLADGLSWQVSVVNNNVLAGRDDGIFRVSNDKLVPIANNTGFWLFEPLLNTPGSSLIAAGNYEGVRVFDQNGGTFIDKGNISSFNESARFLGIDDRNTIWTSHPYRGIYKLGLNQSKARLYGRAEGLPSSLDNFIFKIRNRVVAATQKGIYEYNYNTDRFELSPEFSGIFGTKSLRYLKEDPNGNIWFVEGKSLGVVDFSAKEPEIIYFPELTGRVLSGFENVYPVDSQNIFVGSENGFYHLNYAKYRQNIRPLNVYIRKVKAIADNTDSLLFGGYFKNVNGDIVQNTASIPSLSYLWNSIHLEYSSPVFEAQSNVTYSYFLDGFDHSWSEWTKKTEKDYTNLAAGNYTFKVKARNHQNNESAVYSYSFTINPPWYQTIWAYILYLIIIVYLLYAFYKRQERRHIRDREKELQLQQEKNEELQREMAYQHQLELEISEKELVKLRNEKLESEIEFKNSELATTAMTLVQKKEFILKVQNELQRLQKLGKETIDTIEIKKILRLLSEEKKVNEEWEQFSAHFNKVHADFLTVIKERYPTINQQELKLCAYLIMNLSSKEIAQLLSISVRGVEISRYRLRKKLQIPTEVNLFEFLFEIQRDCLR
ncbi:triple tyrosine motif-containing protein [Mucilaginibacter ximonensis]|uniref:Triple tyrosine motif-containing protein n=1 Tax=Mucilaginibacter ximonensis TaxID=538021 RepID=A0ABW5YH46_9SPHI